MWAHEPLDVHPPTLSSEAGSLDLIAREVALARDAGDAVRLDAGAYGQICVLLPQLIAPLQAALSDTIGAASESIADTAYRLRAVAAAYEAIDAEVARTMAVT